MTAVEGKTAETPNVAVINPDSVARSKSLHFNLAQGHFLPENPICDWCAVGEFVLVSFVLCLCFCRDPGDCLSFVLVWSLLHWLSN